MGSVCCCCQGEVNPDDVTGHNPMEPHHNWALECKEDIDKSEPLSICRDFPRTCVLVGETTEKKSTSTHDFAGRNQLVRDRIVELMQLIEATENVETMISKFTVAWEKELSSEEVKASADISGHLSRIMLETGLFGYKSREPVDDTNVQIKNGDIETTSRTAMLMNHLHQGFVFYPVQRIHHLVWFPWARRLRDVEWIARVFKRQEMPEYIFIHHSQRTQNYIEDSEKSHTPRFELLWAAEITLEASSCAWIDGKLNVFSVKIEKPGFCTSALYRARRDRLVDRLQSSFSALIEIEDVADL